MKELTVSSSLRTLTVKQLTPDRAKITLIDKSNPLSHAVSLVWTDRSLHVDDFDLSVLGKVDAVQADLLAYPPRGWVVLDGECRRRIGSFVKLLPRKLRPKRP